MIVIHSVIGKMKYFAHYCKVLFIGEFLRPLVLPHTTTTIPTTASAALVQIVHSECLLLMLLSALHKAAAFS